MNLYRGTIYKPMYLSQSIHTWRGVMPDPIASLSLTPYFMTLTSSDTISADKAELGVTGSAPGRNTVAAILSFF